MTGFDAELHLRLVGERVMIGAELSDLDRSDGELDLTAAALVVGGVIDEKRATEICSACALASEMVRRPALARRLSLLRPPGPEEEPPDLDPRRVFTPGAVLDLVIGELRVRSVTLAEGRTAIEGAP